MNVQPQRRTHTPVSFEEVKVKLVSAFYRLNFSVDPQKGWERLARKGRELSKFNRYQIVFLIILAIIDLLIMGHSLLVKIFLIVAYATLISLPISAQIIMPGTPILAWLLTYYSSQFIDKEYRPHIWVSVLPTLESVLYGANVSDILTRYTSWFLDVLAWIPYGIVHFAAPFFVAIACYVFAPMGSTAFFGSAFGYLNLAGVLIQILFPCAPPWYELRHGLVPANYDMGGSPGGLARIDALFHSNGYTAGFTNSPVVFGAFPSLHAACSTMEALFLSHFFPEGRVFWWLYAFWLYWSTMYLTHHYLIDLVVGGSLAVFSFYFFLPRDLRVIQPNGIDPIAIPIEQTVFADEELNTKGSILPSTTQATTSHSSGFNNNEFELVDVRVADTSISEFAGSNTTSNIFNSEDYNNTNMAVTSSFKSSVPHAGASSGARARSSSTTSKNGPRSSSSTNETVRGGPNTSFTPTGVTRSRSSSLTNASSPNPRAKSFQSPGLPPPYEESAESLNDSSTPPRIAHTRERSKSMLSLPVTSSSSSIRDEYMKDYSKSNKNASPNSSPKR